jgi:hypothetical protein
LASDRSRSNAVADTAERPCGSGSDPVNIAEFAPGGTAPKHGNVFEADYQGAFVNEYAQRKNVVLNSCSPGGGVESIAEDTHDNVFVAYNGSSGKIVEYKGGLKGCKATPLAPTFTFVGGMVIDKNGTLLVCDQQGKAVDLIAKPYTSITGTLGNGFGTPFHISLNKANSRVFVTDVLNYDVRVVKYPSGDDVTSLGSGDGIQDPFSAVDGPNAVY